MLLYKNYTRMLLNVFYANAKSGDSSLNINEIMRCDAFWLNFNFDVPRCEK